MNRLEKHFNEIEEQINNLPIDVNNENFAEQREKLLGHIHGNLLEIFQRIEKDENLIENLTEKIITIQEITTQKIKEITNKNTQHELLYKRGEEKINVEEKIGILIENHLKKIENIFNEIMLITGEEKIKGMTTIIEKIKKNIIFLYPIISSEEKKRIEIILEKYENVLQKI